MTPVLIDPRGIYQDADCEVIRDIADVGEGLLSIPVVGK
jgi:hypothetical protein